MNRQYIMWALSLIWSLPIQAQQPPIHISTYNTGARFELKRAPFGRQMDILDSVKTMVFAQDGYEVKKTPASANFVAPTRAEVKSKIEENKPSNNPQRVTEAEIEKVKKNAAKRSCVIDPTDLKGKIVLVDFDKNCDPAEKCLQAQQAGAFAVVVIYDHNKKDSINMAKSRVSDAVTIPCYSIIRQQGDSLRVMLPSKSVFFRPRPTPPDALAQNTDTVSYYSNKLPKESVVTAPIQNKDNPQEVLYIEGNSQDNFIQISPNPTHDIAYVQYALSKMTNLRLEIKNAVGQIVYSQKYENTQIGTIDITTHNWANGLYAVHIFLGAEKVIKKLVVQH